MNRNKQTTARNRDEVDTQFEFMALGVLGSRIADTPQVAFYQEAHSLVNIFCRHFACDHVPGSPRATCAGFGVAPKQSFFEATLHGSALSVRMETDRRKLREPETASPGRRGDCYPIICPARPGAAAG
jgi:hypothetical protein